MPQDNNLPLVQRRLPTAGLEALLDRPWVPLLNVLMASRSPAAATPGFPLKWMLMAPNTPEFLASLGKPLAIAHDLEAAPGVWWMVTPDGQHEYIVFSDSHRKNSWKGGQLCIASKDPALLTASHPGVVALQRAFEQVWGLPGPAAESRSAHTLEELVWFGERTREAGPFVWPQAAPPRITRSMR